MSRRPRPIRHTADAAVVVARLRAADSDMRAHLKKPSLSNPEAPSKTESIKQDPVWQTWAAEARPKIQLVWESCKALLALGDHHSLNEAKEATAFYFLKDGLLLSNLVDKPLMDRLFANAADNEDAAAHRKILFRNSVPVLFVQADVHTNSVVARTMSEVIGVGVHVNESDLKPWAAAWLRVERAYHALCVLWGAHATHGWHPTHNGYRPRDWRRPWRRMVVKVERYEKAVRAFRRLAGPRLQTETARHSRELEHWLSIAKRPWCYEKQLQVLREFDRLRALGVRDDHALGATPKPATDAAAA